MHKTYVNPVYPYQRSADFDAADPVHHPVVIVGAGPGGLALSLDLAQQGISSVVLDDNNTVSVGSRAICFAKRTLEIMNRYGCAKRMVDKGVTWQHGKVFFQNSLVFDFDLLPEENHKLPAFINLQQYYFEEFLADRISEFEQIDLRWKNKVLSVNAQESGSVLQVGTPDGEYTISCDYLLVADGANSKIRSMLGLESKGQVFQDRFLIADVVMKADFPTERWFWFDPPFHPNQSALLHRQADDVWRIDLQLGWDADPEHEKREEVIRPRIEAMLGKDVEFELEWSSVYTFQCRKMDNFIYKNVFFVGDAAHQVSPFGARGANGCIQSVENLAWKLSRVLTGQAPSALLQTYNIERQEAARENIKNSTRSTDFITPKNPMSKAFRDETLKLANHYPFARPLVNSGRLSTPCVYQESPLNSPTEHVFRNAMIPGAAPCDGPIEIKRQPAWLIDLLGIHFTVMIYIDQVPSDELDLTLSAIAHQPDLNVLLVSASANPQNLPTVGRVVHDKQGLIAQRYDLTSGATYLFRPDQIICARWRSVTAPEIITAMQRALGFKLELSA